MHGALCTEFRPDEWSPTLRFLHAVSLFFLLLSRLELSDTKVYGPEIRARLGSGVLFRRRAGDAVPQPNLGCYVTRFAPQKALHLLV